MNNLIVRGALAYIRDGKRLTAAFIALYQLLAPKLTPLLANVGIDLPAGAGEQAASWAAVALLNLWSKLEASRAARPG